MNLIRRTLNWLKPRRNAAAPVSSGRNMNARYDAAQTTDDNRRHWANADDYSASWANRHEVRKILRKRSRYEIANNSYAAGLMTRRACDLVGTGPQLQLTIKGVPRADQKRLQDAWADWKIASKFDEKLRILDETRFRDGESFAILTTNPLIPGPVKLDLRLIEADQFANPTLVSTSLTALSATDGIEFDPYGNPKTYTVLKAHPGDMLGLLPTDSVKVDAAFVVHWFRPTRPGQVRGVPELTPALEMFSQLRRYTLATLTAAEIAAMLAGIMKSDIPPEENSATDSTFQRVEFERGALLTLPPGWDATQFKPEQPTGTYKEFKSEILGEIGRAVDVPFNVITGNSAGYNYSSGRLDHLPYHRTLATDRNRLRYAVLDRVFLAFAAEYLLAEGVVNDLPPVEEWRWRWFWPGFKSIEPDKDAATDTERLTNLTTNYAEIYAEYGQDWEEMFEQIAAEKKRMKELGIEPADVAPQPAPNANTAGVTDDEEVPVGEA